MPAFHATPGCLTSSSARAGLGFSSNASSGYAWSPSITWPWPRGAGSGSRTRSPAARPGCRASPARRPRPSAPVASRVAAVRSTSRNTPSSRMEWSAGSTIITSSSGRSTATVASAIAAAVLRPAGSISTRTSGSWARTSCSYRWSVTIVTSIGTPSPIDAGEPPHRRLEEALVAEQRHERLGALGARQRPQAGAAPARHHDHVHRAILGSAGTAQRVSGHFEPCSRAKGTIEGEAAPADAHRASRVAACPRIARISQPEQALATRTSNRRARGRVDVVLAASYHPRTGRGRGGRSARVEERV